MGGPAPIAISKQNATVRQHQHQKIFIGRNKVKIKQDIRVRRPQRSETRAPTESRACTGQDEDPQAAR